MSDFLPGPPTDIPVPPGEDSFDVPPADFLTVGKLLATGAQQAGGLLSIGKDFLTWLAQSLGFTLGWALNKILFIASYLLGILNNVNDTSLPGFDALGARSLEHVFGVNVSSNLTGISTNPDARRVVAATIGQAVYKSIISQGATAGTGGIQPTSQPAMDFLTTASHIGLEGWLEESLVSIFPSEWLKGFGELAPIMANVLGIGRMSRRVLQPPLKILVQDPFTQLLNQTYRPTKLSEADAVKQFVRGRWTREQLDAEMALLGYRADYVEALINRDAKFLSVGDVNYLISRGNWSQAQGVQHLMDQGYTQDMANTVLALDTHKLTDGIFTQIAESIGAAYVSRDIDQATFQSMLGSIGLPQFQLAALELRFETERNLNIKHLSLADIVTGIKQGILTVDDLRTEMLRQGYPDVEETEWELIQLAKITDAQTAAGQRAQIAADKAAAAKAKEDAAAAAKAAKLAAAADKGLSITQFEALVRDGLRSIADYRAFLITKGYSQADASDLSNLLSDQVAAAKTKADAAQALRDKAKSKTLDIAQLEKGVMDGFISIQDYQVRLAQVGYSHDDIQLLANELQAQIDATKAKADAHAAAVAKLASKGLSLAQEETAVKLGIKTIDDYNAYLTANGFAPETVATLAAIMQDTLDQLQAARDQKTAAAGALKVKGISLAEMDKAVVAGVHDLAWYGAQLAAQGYNASDQATLISLLQVDLDKQRAVADAKARAQAKSSANQIPIATVEKMVVEGGVAFDALNAEMQERGIDPDDQQLIQLDTMEKISAAKAADAKKAAGGKTPAPKGLTPAELEQSVLDGLKTIAEYRAQLSMQGFAADDIDTLAALLQDKLDVQSQQATVRARITGQLPAGALTPAQWEKAVKAGDRTLDDYAAYLQAQGYGPADVATLVSLATPKPPKPAGGAGGTSPGTVSPGGAM